MFGYVWYSALLLGVPSCEQYPSQPLFPNLWDSNIHWVGLGVNLPETMVVFPMKKRGSCDFSLPIHWNINDPFPLSHAHIACLLKFHKEAPGVAVPFDRKRVVTFKCLKDVIYIWVADKMTYYSLLAMDMAKVGDPLSVVKVCTSMLCVKIGYR